ncbi:hypothetical protein Tco_1180968 [Tanacetum coccineum]
MGDENPIRTLGDYSKPSHEGYRNTIEFPVGNNVVPLRSDTIRIHLHMGGSYYPIPCSILSTGKDRKTPQRYPDVSTTSWRILSEAWTHFKDLLQKVSHHGIDLWLQVQIFYDHVNPITRRTIDQSAGVKAIALPQDVPSTSDRRLIELENQAQSLMEAHLAPTQPTQVNKITTPYDIYSGPHDTRHCMKNPE